MSFFNFFRKKNDPKKVFSKKEEKTELDSLLGKQRRGESKDVDKDADRFYRLLLDTLLFVPTIEVPEKRERLIATDESFSPIIVEDAGKQYIPLFDTEEKFNNWSKGRRIGFVALKGKDMISILPKEYLIALNPGTVFLKTFVKDELEWLRSVAEGREIGKNHGEVNIPEGTQMRIGQPDPRVIPSALRDALRSYFIDHPEVEKAYFAIFEYVAEKRWTLAIVIDVNPYAPSHDVIESEIVKLISDGLIPRNMVVDVLIKKEKGPESVVVKTIPPFYSKM